MTEKIGANRASAKTPSLESLDPKAGSGGHARAPFLIDREAAWHYRGSPIERPALVKLFASILVRNPDGRHWLRTPVEEVEVEVEDAPFLAVALVRHGQGRAQSLELCDNLDRWVPVDAAHPLRLAEGAGGRPRPYIALERGLEARITRAVFYDLADLVEPDPEGGDRLGLWSSDRFFPLSAA